MLVSGLVCVPVELTSDTGKVANYWLCKPHTFPLVLGCELDYTQELGTTVVLEQILVDPCAENGQPNIRGVQKTWLSLTVGEFIAWEHAGWQKTMMDSVVTDQ